MHYQKCIHFNNIHNKNYEGLRFCVEVIIYQHFGRLNIDFAVCTMPSCYTFHLFTFLTLCVLHFQ